MLATTAASYLETLNPEQRRAVEHGVTANGHLVIDYSRCVNAEIELENLLGASYPWCAGWAAALKELFAAYVEAKQKHNVLDYDDLLSTGYR